jgi:hypothetical protein
MSKRGGHRQSRFDNNANIALEMLVTRALDKDDQKLLALMTKRVGVTLRLQRVNGIVRSSSGPGQYMIWEIAR